MMNVQTNRGHIDSDPVRRPLRPARGGIGELRAGFARRPIAPPEDASLIASELRELGVHQCAFADAGYQVFVARRYQVPTVVYEIGRLRELSSREAGAGTNLARDLDAFDDRAMHVFVWERARREIVGATRFFVTDAVLLRHRVEGLCSSEWFDFDPGFWSKLGPTLEVGRTFVRPECQISERVRTALRSGLYQFASERPQYKTLLHLGNLCPRASAPAQQLIVETLLTGSFRHPLSSLVVPKHRIPQAPLRCFPLARNAPNLAAQIAAIEPEGHGLNPWLREALSSEGRFIAFGRSPTDRTSIAGMVSLPLPSLP